MTPSIILLFSVVRDLRSVTSASRSRHACVTLPSRRDSLSQLRISALWRLIGHAFVTVASRCDIGGA